MLSGDSRPVPQGCAQLSTEAESGQRNIARVSISHKQLVLFFQSLGLMLTRVVAEPSVGAGGGKGAF